jgi:hypothetical protein
MEKINGDTEVYTFEYIVDQVNYPKAYGRKFVVVEKYKELLEKYDKCLSTVKKIYKEESDDPAWFTAQGCLHEIKELE